MCNIAYCSLHEAINAANSQSGAHTIQFQDGLNGTIRLQGTLPPITLYSDHHLLGAAIITISGDSDNDSNPNVRLLDITGGTIHLSGLSLIEGQGDDEGGGVILVRGGESAPTGRVNSKIHDNTAPFGGGIENHGTLILTNVEVGTTIPFQVTAAV